MSRESVQNRTRQNPLSRSCPFVFRNGRPGRLPRVNGPSQHALSEYKWLVIGARTKSALAGKRACMERIDRFAPFGWAFGPEAPSRETIAEGLERIRPGRRITLRPISRNSSRPLAMGPSRSATRRPSPRCSVDFGITRTSPSGSRCVCSVELVILYLSNASPPDRTCVELMPVATLGGKLRVYRSLRERLFSKVHLVFRSSAMIGRRCARISASVASNNALQV